MKKFTAFLFLLFNRKSLGLNYGGSFTLIKEKVVPFANFSLVPNTKPTILPKSLCFYQCFMNEFCSFVIYHDNICSLHTEYALKKLNSNKSLNVLFLKNSTKE